LIVDKGRAVDQLAAECFVREAVLLDLTNTKPSEAIDDEDLEGAEEEAGLTAREGEAVIIHTGWERNENEPLNHPVLSRNAAEYLEFKRVSMVAADTPNLDSPVDRAVQVHDILLRKGIPVVENLTNFGELDQSRFRLVVLPLKIHARATLARALAILED
jgi:kynurenine formamidase